MKEGAKIVTPFDKFYAIGVKLVFIIGTAYGAYSFVFNIGVAKSNEQFEGKIILSKLDSVRQFQIQYGIDRIEDKKITDSLINIFGQGMELIHNQGEVIRHIKTSQDSLKAYYIRKAVTKQDLQEVLRIFDTEKKNEYLMTR